MAEKVPTLLKPKMIKGAAATAAIGSVALPATAAETPAPTPLVEHGLGVLAPAKKENFLKIGGSIFRLAKMENGSHRKTHTHVQANTPNHNPTQNNTNVNYFVPTVIPGNNATDAFTPTWWRCVITPESSNTPGTSDRVHITSGLFGILVSTWNAYGMSGVPGNYSAKAQEDVALKIYRANGGFGPTAWNNTAGCGKGG